MADVRPVRHLPSVPPERPRHTGPPTALAQPRTASSSHAAMPADGAGTHQTAATVRPRAERLAELRQTATARPQCSSSRRPSRRRTSRCSPRGPDVIAEPHWLTSHRFAPKLVVPFSGRTGEPKRQRRPRARVGDEAEARPVLVMRARSIRFGRRREVWAPMWPSRAQRLYLRTGWTPTGRPALLRFECPGHLIWLRPIIAFTRRSGRPLVDCGDHRFVFGRGVQFLAGDGVRDRRRHELEPSWEIGIALQLVHVVGRTSAPRSDRTTASVSPPHSRPMASTAMRGVLPTLSP